MFSALFIRIIGAIVLGIAGWRLGEIANNQNWTAESILWIVLPAVVGAGLGFWLAAYVQNWFRRKVRQIPGHVLFAAFLGVAVALVASAILALPLSLLPGIWGAVAPAIIAVVLVYFGVFTMAQHGSELTPFFGPALSKLLTQGEGRDSRVILDTNSIIDARIADITETGFIHGTLVIPKFVLDELHYIADSADPMRRARGRRGLDILTKLQRESDIPVQISDMDFEDVPEVDAKLVELAKALRCPIVTNDVNLNRVASLQGVRVLNINELANALKPAILPNEELHIKVVQEGKERGQGIGYLDDGTMVVVEGGRRHLNNDIRVTVNRVLQTGAGRMIFAQYQDQN